MSWKSRNRSSITNKTSIYGDMGGLVSSRKASGASSNRATNKLVIPSGAVAGLRYMKMYNLLSKNPLGSGGIGKVVKSKPCHCGSTSKPIKEKEDILGDGETPPVNGTGVIPITQANIYQAVTHCISGGGCCANDPSYAPMSSWDTSAVTDMSNLFQYASGFNCDISGWNTSNVTNMRNMFERVLIFNQPLNWNTSSVTNMEFMFSSARAFNGDISKWDTKKVTNMAGLFRAAIEFNQPLSWNTISVTNMSGMFYKATKFNGDINGWDTSSVTKMEFMFNDASAFNKDISKWNTANVIDMGNMFKFATKFKQNLSGWCVENITFQPQDFSNHLMTHAQMPHWNDSCICTDASGIKTDRCHPPDAGDWAGGKGCKIHGSSNICCVNWLHGSGCIDSTGLCYLDSTDMSLCGRPIDISCTPQETLGGTIQAKSSNIPCSDLSNIGGAVTNVNSPNAFGAPGQGYYCCMSGSDLCNNIPGCLRDGSMNRASMVCVSGCEDITCQDVVDISNVGNWKRIAPMGTARMGLGLAAASNGKIYAVGGVDSTFTSFKSAEVYDPKSNKWRSIAPMDASRAYLGLAAIGDKIYAVGGWGGGKIRKVERSSEMYEPSTKTWTDISSMNAARFDFGLASLNGKLYAVGGSGGTRETNDLSSVEVYDPNTNNWTAVKPMTTGRSSGGIAAIEASDMPADMCNNYPEGLLYVAAGSTDTNAYDTSGEFYDPSSNAWEPVGSLANSGLWWPGMAALHGKIYIVGGDGGGAAQASGEVYDVSSTGLIHMPPIVAMAEARAQLGVAALNGKLYAVGGGISSPRTPLNTGEVYTPYPS